MMNLITFALIALLSTPTFAQDTEYLTAEQCAEYFDGDKLKACVLNALLVESEMKRAEAEAEAEESQGMMVLAMRSAEREEARADDLEKRISRPEPLPEPATSVEREPVREVEPAGPVRDPYQGHVAAMQITRRGTEYAAVTNRIIRGVSSQLCITSTAYGADKHVRGGDDTGSIRVVAMKDGIPLEPDLGHTVNTGQILADLRGDGDIQVYMAFHPATDKACFDARPGETITLAFLVDSGQVGALPIDLGDDGVVDYVAERPIYGGEESESVWVGYTKPGVGLTVRNASGGHVVFRMD